MPGSEDFSAEQSFLQPPEHQTDIVHVIRGVIEAETGAIEHYTQIIEETDGIDPVTQDMVIAILRDEQGHRRLSRASCANTSPRARPEARRPGLWRSPRGGRLGFRAVNGITDENELRPIGRVESPLREPEQAPKQGDEGAPEAVLVLEQRVAAGLRGLRAGEEVLVLTSAGPRRPRGALGPPP